MPAQKKGLTTLIFWIAKRGNNGKRGHSGLAMFLFGSQSQGTRRATGRPPGAGFTLMELMIVITIILILISIAAPVYRNSIIRAKEAVLQDHLFTLRSLIDQYTLDKQEAPQSLEDLVKEGYLRGIPVDPFTKANNTWVVVYENNILMNPSQRAPGIVDLHSGSNQTSQDGSAYSSW